MLKLSGTLIGQQVLSLRTGAVVATTHDLLINPDNLKIEGLYCRDRFSGDELILLPQDIRDFVPQGIAINDHDALAEADDLIRLKELIKLDFRVLGKPIYTVRKKRLGKVADFAVDSETLYIQKLYASQTFLKSLSSGQLSIDRSQIVETTPHRIIVHDPLQPTRASAPATA